jgi:hypothetical protein
MEHRYCPRRECRANTSSRAAATGRESGVGVDLGSLRKEPPSYSDAKVANREMRVWHGATERLALE